LIIPSQNHLRFIQLQTRVNKISYDWKDFFKGLVNEI